MRGLLCSSSATTPSGSRRSATKLGRVDVLVSPVRVGEVTRAGVLGRDASGRTRHNRGSKQAMEHVCSPAVKRKVVLKPMVLIK